MDITTGDLATVVGAGAAALIVAQFAKSLFNLSTRATRIVAMVTGLAVVVLATATIRGFANVVEVVLAIVVGMQAGQSASSTFDTVAHGLGYEASNGSVS